MENEGFRFNSSWCYGSLGMARVLYNIAKIIDSQKFREMATDVFTSSIDYINSSEILNMQFAMDGLESCLCSIRCI